jgi:hypothetical protein
MEIEADILGCGDVCVCGVSAHCLLGREEMEGEEATLCLNCSYFELSQCFPDAFLADTNFHLLQFYESALGHTGKDCRRYYAMTSMGADALVSA